MRKELEEKSSGSIMYASKINDSLEIRLMPPSASMDGAPFFEVTKWNVGDKTVTSPKTFGYPCPIDEEVTVAATWVKANANSQDAATRQFAKDLSKLLNNWESCKEKSEYLIPVIILSNVGDSYSASQPKLLSCGATIVKDITGIMVDRKYMNGTPYGITDRVRGRNFTVTKTGVKKETKYKAIPWPNEMEMPAELYEDKKFIDPVRFTKKGMKSEAYLRSLIRNYLYGEVLMEEEPFFDEGDIDTQVEENNQQAEVQQPVQENLQEVVEEPKLVEVGLTPGPGGIKIAPTSNSGVQQPMTIKVGVTEVKNPIEEPVNSSGPQPIKVNVPSTIKKGVPTVGPGAVKKRSIGAAIKTMGTNDKPAE